jgi:D-alanyl-D-alanine carboxypeptidase
VVGVRRTVLLLASVFLAMLLASGVALGVTPLGDTAEKTDADATAAARGPDAALDRALKELIAMPGGPPGVIAVVQRGQHREVHAFGAAKLGNQWPRPPRVDDRMRIASAAKAFSGAVALSLVSKGALSLDDTIG